MILNSRCKSTTFRPAERGTPVRDIDRDTTMVYRFKLISDEVSNFMREIEVDSENTFLQLRNCILESVGYSKDELDSFFLCNDDWEMEEEITLEDMGNSSSDVDQWLMESTEVSELVEDEGQKLVFEFDYLNERSFFMELKEIIPGRSLADPVCTMKRGNAPKQFKEFAEPEVASAKVADMEELDLESFGEPDFNDEDIDSGYDITDMNVN